MEGDLDSEPMPATDFSEVANELESAEKYLDVAIASELRSEAVSEDKHSEIDEARKTNRSFLEEVSVTLNVD